MIILANKKEKKDEKKEDVKKEDEKKEDDEVDKKKSICYSLALRASGKVDFYY